MVLSLNSPGIFQLFDELVSSNIILYGPTEPIEDVDQGFPFEFRICPVFDTKPQNPGDKYIPSSQPLGISDAPPAEAPKFGPGSDIYCVDQRIIVSTINGSHLLVFNKFCVYRPQYILLTIDSFKRQWEDLDETDIRAAWDVINASPAPHFAIYNGGPEAGCSRNHKHMQIFPRPVTVAIGEERDPFSLFWGDEVTQGRRESNVPFRYFLKRVNPRAHDAPAILYAQYVEMMKECRRALRLDENSQERCPHNVVLVKEGIMVIPRTRARIGTVSANAAGMIGLVWVAEKEQLEKWREYGPAKVLGQLGISPNRA